MGALKNPLNEHSKHVFKLMGKKIMTFLLSKSLLKTFCIWEIAKDVLLQTVKTKGFTLFVKVN